mmetsp:Transcript_8112/g.12852  ORF Transcript_8112/g.12852 Transcript_8112/m.12852 type:complete len:202 (-) Transcript_8112:115-720(-)
MWHLNLVLLYFIIEVACYIPTGIQALTTSSLTISRQRNLYAVKSDGTPDVSDEDDQIDDDNNDLNFEAFQTRKKQQEDSQRGQETIRDFDGYALRDVIYEKWGYCYDLDFNPVSSFGFRKIYLNVLPFHLGGRRFRHETELDYLCHLQAIVEILEKYEQLDYVLTQIEETDKRPRAGTSPLVAVPLRLDLTREQVEGIIGC